MPFSRSLVLSLGFGSQPEDDRGRSFNCIISKLMKMRKLSSIPAHHKGGAMATSNWVDFRSVKESVTMSMALDHYQVNWLRKSKDELRGRCPIHNGEGTDTFHVNISKNAFQCFSCKARGNVLDFVAAMEKCSVRDAALKLQDWFSIPAAAGDRSSTPVTTPASDKPGRGEELLINSPLKFQLKGVDCSHAYLQQRGIRKETAEEFGVGFYSGRGSMSGRIVIPIHNERGELVAYAGRAIDNSEPRYKLPAGFHKSAAVFNAHRVLAAGTHEVILVEGFFDCMKVYQEGFPALALMGSSLSEQQERLLAEHFKVAVLLFDGDDAGRAATDQCLLRLGRKMWVKAVMLPDGKQPDSLAAEELRGLLEK